MSEISQESYCDLNDQIIQLNEDCHLNQNLETIDLDEPLPEIYTTEETEENIELCQNPKCGLNYQTGEFNEHLAKDCPKRKQCSDCLKFFENNAALVRHYRSKHDKAFICKLCGGQFASDYNLRRHFAYQHKDKEDIEKLAALNVLKCSQCNKEFVGNWALKTHIQAKHNKNFVCTICAKIFASDYSLRRHLTLKHKDEQKEAYINEVKCPQCDKTFAGNWTLTRHIQAKHEKIFKCKYCEKECSSESSLQKHLESKHNKLENKTENENDKNKWKCPKCILSFSAIWILKKHVESKHDKKFTCEICKEVLANEFTLRRHKTRKHKTIVWLKPDGGNEVENSIDDDSDNDIYNDDDVLSTSRQKAVDKSNLDPLYDKYEIETVLVDFK